MLGTLAVAAGLAMVVAFLNSALGGGAWEIASLEGEGIPTVDGRPVPSSHADQLARRIRPGVRLRIPHGLALEIRSPGAIAVEIAPGTDVTVPRRPGRWWGREMACELGGGSIRVATADGFQGGPFVVVTPAAGVVMGRGVGAIAAEPGGTRVAVLAGRATAGTVGATTVTVEAGWECFLHNTALEPSSAPLRISDREALERLARARP